MLPDRQCQSPSSVSRQSKTAIIKKKKNTHVIDHIPIVDKGLCPETCSKADSPRLLEAGNDSIPVAFISLPWLPAVSIIVTGLAVLLERTGEAALIGP